MDTKPYEEAVAKAVVEAMVRQGFSQKALAEATDIPRVTLIRRLNGATPFTVKELRAIGHAMNVPVVEFLAAGEVPA